MLHDRILRLSGALPSHADLHAVRQRHQPAQVLSGSARGGDLRARSNRHHLPIECDVLPLLEVRNYS